MFRSRLWMVDVLSHGGGEVYIHTHTHTRARAHAMVISRPDLLDTYCLRSLTRWLVSDPRKAYNHVYATSDQASFESRFERNRAYGPARIKELDQLTNWTNWINWTDGPMDR